MIDIHCHILPAIDDGPADIEAAIAMARLAVADGTRVMVATPHVGETIHPPGELRGRIELLVDALKKFNIALEVLFGAEIVFNLRREALSSYCINGSNYFLIEFPHSHLPSLATDLISGILGDGLVPIIAHPERNPSIIRQPKLLLDLVEQGALVQVTAGSLTGDLGMSSQVCANYLLKRGAVHFLASDGHSANWRPPILSAGVKKAAKFIGRGMAQKLVRDNPGTVVRGEKF